MQHRKKQPRLDRAFHVVRRVEAAHCSFEERLSVPSFPARWDMERRALGMTVEAAAKKVGVSQARISQVVRHEASISWDLYRAMMRAVNHRPYEWVREWDDHARDSDDPEDDSQD